MTTPADPRKIDLLWAPFLALLLAIVLLNAGAALIDWSELEQAEGSWGYLFGAVVVSFLYAPLPLVALLVTAVVGTATDKPATRQVMTGLGTYIAVVAGGALLLLGLWALWAEGLYGASVAFTALLLVCAAICAGPLVVRLRRSQNDAA